MLKFVRLLAFAELIGGCLWLWPAVFPKQLTVMDFARAAHEQSVPQEPVPVSPLPGLLLIGFGSLSLSVASLAADRQATAADHAKH